MAEKLFTVAKGRGGVASGAAAGASGGWAKLALDETSMLLETARRFADEKAGSIKPMNTARITLTTIDSMRVKARQGFFRFWFAPSLDAVAGKFWRAGVPRERRFLETYSTDVRESLCESYRRVTFLRILRSAAP